MKKARAPRPKRPKLDFELYENENGHDEEANSSHHRITNETKGLPVLLSYFNGGVKYEPGKEVHTMASLLSHYRQWANDMFPPSPFIEALHTIEELGQTQRLKVCMHVYICMYV